MNIFRFLVLIAFQLTCLTTFSQSFTQGAAAVSTTLTDIRDNAFSGTVAMGWGERETMGFKISKSSETTIWTGPTAEISIHDSLVVNYAAAGSAPTGFNSIKTDFSSIEPGKKWSSEYTVTQAPASWCPSSNEMVFTTSFKVGDKQPFDITINGEKRTVEVFPVFERGYWKRCYSSKVFRKLMYSKELSAVVSLESVMYSVSTGKPGSVFSMTVLEFK